MIVDYCNLWKEYCGKTGATFTLFDVGALWGDHLLEIQNCKTLTRWISVTVFNFQIGLIWEIKNKRYKEKK